MANKNRENRLRRRAAGLGLYIAKSRSRTLEDPGHGGYMVFEPQYSVVIIGCDSFAYDADLDDVEQCLSDWQARLAGPSPTASIDHAEVELHDDHEPGPGVDCSHRGGVA